MGMISCPECGKSISDKADACPNCGYKLKKNSNSTPYIIGMCILAIIALTVYGFLHYGEEKPNQGESFASDSLNVNNSNDVPSFLQVGEETVYTYMFGGDNGIAYEIHLYADKTAKVTYPQFEGKPPYLASWKYVHNTGSSENKQYDYWYITVPIEGYRYISIRQDGKGVEGDADDFTHDADHQVCGNVTIGAYKSSKINTESTEEDNEDEYMYDDEDYSWRDHMFDDEDSI